jgi:periplasmic protein CpxP/Spy
MAAGMLICAVLFAGQVFAQGPGRGMGPPPGEMGPGFGGPGMMLRDLDLSDAQQAQVKDLMTAFHTASEPYRTQMRDLGQQLQTATAKGAYDEPTVRSIAEKQAKAQVEMTVLNQKLRSDIYQILTPEQRTKVDEGQTRMQNRMRQGMPRSNR